MVLDPITIGAGVAFAGSSILGLVRRRARMKNEGQSPSNSAERANDPGAGAQKAAAAQKAYLNELLAPAYPNLVNAPVTVREALRDVAQKLGIPAHALATVIQSESRWTSTVPKDAAGTPRAGLIQITQGANLPGLKNAETIWNVRTWSAERQLDEIVVPYFSRMNLNRVRASSDPAFELYKLNFLPGDAGKDDGFKLGEKGSKELVHPKARLTRGDVYRENPVFHGNGAKPFFTWADVRAKVRSTEKEATGGKWVTVGGQLVDAPALDKMKALETKSETTTITVPAKAGAPGPTFAEGSSCEVARSLRVLLKEIDAAWPNRLRASDGLCGDKAHQERNSDHNTGNALDVTLDLNNGPNLDALAELLLKDKRTKYIVWNRRIASPEIDGGKWRDYPSDASKRDKVNPHTRHLHLSIRADARDDAAPWNVAKAKKTLLATDDTDKLLLDPVSAWRSGKVDNFAWVPLAIGDYKIEVAADCLAVNGVRLPVSFANCVSICRGQDMLPNTKAICDARWDRGEKRIVLRTRPPSNHGPDSNLVREVREWSAKIGPVQKQLLMGPWKEWVIDSVREPGNATNYGLWGPNGKPIQTLGRRHDEHHVDDTQLFAPVRRTAVRAGKKVDLLEELGRGCPLGGPVPKWLLERLR